MLIGYKSENTNNANVLDLTLIIAAKDLDRTQHDLRGEVSLNIAAATSEEVKFGFAFAPLPAIENERRLLKEEEPVGVAGRKPTAPFEGAVATCNVNVSKPEDSTFTSEGIYYDGEIDTYNSGISSLSRTPTNNYLIDAENSNVTCEGKNCTIVWKWTRAFEVDAASGHTIEEQVEVDYATYAFYETASGDKGQNTVPAVFFLGALSGLSQVFFATTIMIATFAF